MEKKRLYELAIAGLTVEMEKVERAIGKANYELAKLERPDSKTAVKSEAEIRKIIQRRNGELEELAKELFDLKTELFEVECEETE